MLTERQGRVLLHALMVWVRSPDVLLAVQYICAFSHGPLYMISFSACLVRCSCALTKGFIPDFVASLPSVEA